ncbi:DNA internalization-related competence protein ComEC/Rec2 [Lentilactobacillus sp. Marseille-Q4993]|uniref:DNA internalization-related competence protein ComEC/Rec2 n=1 Tax=Lentilactobacillus sp. Marseille-Q4993 TaxID=3039492 RepID=UPI0024BCB470|nr:DNA internalization-related competence protein ComEC/Rec2 [Lentilactobacillus sp. Marseille-Q4993]
MATLFAQLYIIGTILGVWIIVRLVFLGDNTTSVVSCICIIIFCLICFIKTEKYSENEVRINQETTEVIKVDPDRVNVNGAVYTFTGKSSSGQPTCFLGRFSSEQEIQLFKAQTKPFWWQVEGKYGSMPEATNVNQFDMRKYYKNIGVNQEFIINKVIQQDTNYRMNVIDRIHAFRAQFIRMLSKMPPTVRTYSEALMCGSRNPSFYDDLSGVTILGLIHLFSISGMHVAYFLKMLESLLKLLRLPRKLINIVAIIFLAAYFVFSGSAAGVFRATVMAGLKNAFQIGKIRISSLDVWSLTLIANLVVNPRAFLLMGVQLTYILSLGIITLSSAGYLKRTLYLNLLSLPIILYHMFEWHVLSLIASIVVMPLFGSIIFPVVIIAVIFNNIPIIVILADTVLNWFNSGLNSVALLPGKVTFGKPYIGITLIILFLSILLVANWQVKRLPVKFWLLGLYVATFCLIHFPIQGEVTMIDVGQGDSFLVREPFNRRISLIDTGGKVTFNQQSWQRGHKSYQAVRIGINYLKSIGISKVDDIYLSHQDADHCGDITAYLDKLVVKNVYVPAGMDKNPQFLKRIESNYSSPRIIGITDKQPLPNPSLQVLHPFESGKGENHDSIVLLANLGGLKWIFTGDLDQQGELDTINRYPNLRVDVLKVGHHGSRTSSAPEFVKKIAPSIGLISAGVNNRYHHPNDETIKTLSQNHIKILNTQKRGMVRYMYSGNNGSFKCFK